MYQNKKIKIRGFILGMSIVILSAAIIIAISISTIVLRDLKISSLAGDSQLVYNLADAGINCFSTDELEFGFVNASGSSRFFPQSPINLRNWFLNMTNYKPETVKCMDVRIFSDSMVNFNYVTPSLSVYTSSGSLVGGVTYVATTTIDYSSNASYAGGAMTKFYIKRSDFPKSSCLEVEIHAKNDTPRLLVARGKVPCYGDKRIERSLSKIIQ